MQGLQHAWRHSPKPWSLKIGVMTDAGPGRRARHLAALEKALRMRRWAPSPPKARRRARARSTERAHRPGLNEPVASYMWMCCLKHLLIGCGAVDVYHE